MSQIGPVYCSKTTPVQHVVRHRRVSKSYPSGVPANQGLLRPAYKLVDIPLFRPGLGPKPQKLPRQNTCQHMITSARSQRYVFAEENKACDGYDGYVLLKSLYLIWANMLHSKHQEYSKTICTHITRGFLAVGKSSAARCPNLYQAKAFC